MTRSTVKKLEEPLDEPERELHRRRKAASHQQWNESLAIAGRNLFDDEPSSIRRRSEGEESPEWVVRSKFEDSLCNFMLEKALHAKGLGEMLDQQWRGMHNQFSKILATFKKSQTPTPNPNALNFAITTRSGTTTLDPPYPTPSNLTTADDTNKTIEEERLENEETTTIQDKEIPSHLPYTIHLNHPVFLTLLG
ncbi:hypothetical protein Tco_0572927 [Tanacetum coccineum]